MTDPQRPDTYDEAFWRDYLMSPNSLQTRGRRIFSRIPSSPRCRQCGAPFRGPGAPIMRILGKSQSAANPTSCTSCYNYMTKHHGGAEVEASLLFADIRGSTALAESMSTAEFHALLDRFYTAASKAVFAHDGIIDKFVGDELMAIWPPMLSADRHSAQAVAAATALLRAVGHEDPDGPWVPLGASVHTGSMWFGAVGVGDHTELTVVGDTVNTAARLAAAAGPGEILVSVAAAAAAGLDADLDRGLERRALDLKGKTGATEVVALRIGPA